MAFSFETLTHNVPLKRTSFAKAGNRALRMRHFEYSLNQTHNAFFLEPNKRIFIIFRCSFKRPATDDLLRAFTVKSFCNVPCWYI